MAVSHVHGGSRVAVLEQARAHKALLGQRFKGGSSYGAGAGRGSHGYTNYMNKKYFNSE
jgi:hypothetical protein